MRFASATDIQRASSASGKSCISPPGGKRIVTDPWLEGNPKCPADRKRIDAADVILLTHGHSDHSGDIVQVSRATGAPILAIHELSLWLEQKGLQNVVGMGIGGTVSVPVHLDCLIEEATLDVGGTRVLDGGEFVLAP